MSWQVSSDDRNGGHQTIHDGVGRHLTVSHEPLYGTEPRKTGSHQVYINNGSGDRHLFMYPSSKHGDKKAYIHIGQKVGGGSHYVDPPSEHLRALIESHGTNHAWMPLLDALAEEYPEHMNGPVERHVQQRASIS